MESSSLPVTECLLRENHVGVTLGNDFAAYSMVKTIQYLGDVSLSTSPSHPTPGNVQFIALESKWRSSQYSIKHSCTSENWNRLLDRALNNSTKFLTELHCTSIPFSYERGKMILGCSHFSYGHFFWPSNVSRNIKVFAKQ